MYLVLDYLKYKHYKYLVGDVMWWKMIKLSSKDRSKLYRDVKQKEAGDDEGCIG